MLPGKITWQKSKQKTFRMPNTIRNFIFQLAIISVLNVMFCNENETMLFSCIAGVSLDLNACFDWLVFGHVV